MHELPWPHTTARQCEHKRVTPYPPWRSTGHPVALCQQPAAFEHEGHVYCKRHAGEVALGLLMKAQALMGTR